MQATDEKLRDNHTGALQLFLEAEATNVDLNLLTDCLLIDCN